MDLKWSFVITDIDSHYFIAQIPEEVSRSCENSPASLHERLWGQVTTSGLVYQMCYPRCCNADGKLSRQWVVKQPISLIEMVVVASGAKIYRPLGHNLEGVESQIQCCVCD